jgi:prolipoprotein diacylglyceryltransferase
MTSQLLTFTWDFERALDLGIFGLRYYSLLFALGFVLGYYLMKNIFKKEGVPPTWLDDLLVYAVVGTIIGARLGHVFFYSWDYYKANPLEILKVWEGGLASHGAAIALIVAMYLFSKKITKKSMFWILDRFVITVALAGCFIRLGNMANSEIYGKISNSSIETVYLDPARQSIMAIGGNAVADVKFSKTLDRLETDSLSYPIYNLTLVGTDGISVPELSNVLQQRIAPVMNNMKEDDRNILFESGQKVDIDELARQIELTVPVLGVPRAPTQIIEALAYFLIFLILFTLFQVDRLKNATGFTFGVFLILVFGFRFLVEFNKANQVDFESGMALNMGQWLSVPLVIGGLAMCVYSLLIKKKSEL